MRAVNIHPEITAAIESAKPIVALETAVVTHGLPREPIVLPHDLSIPGWNATEPANLELGRAMSRAVRAEGAVPAIVAVLKGSLMIGINDDQLVQLASDLTAEKASMPSMASIMTRGRNGGTTVSGTLAACALTHEPGSRAGIRCFATGGIGGVHRDWQDLPDISNDLRMLSATPVCVVSSGAKSILDLPATLEMLESLGVPVVGYRTDCFPRFQCVGDESLRLSQKVENEAAAAKLCEAHWLALKSRSAVVLANPAPIEFAMQPAEMEHAIGAAESLAAERRITGADRTPFLLGEIARQTHNKSLWANLALLIENARVAARVAKAFTL